MQLGFFPVVTAYTGFSSDIIPRIMHLYGQKPVADVTWGRGVFWRKAPGWRVWGSDIVQWERGLTLFADLRALPYAPESIGTLVLDPPFAPRTGSTIPPDFPTASYGNLQHNMQTQQEVLELYRQGLREAWRVLRPGGCAVVKCQDAIEAGKQRWMHIWIWEAAKALGFIAEDLFILVKSGAPPMRHKRQLHARKNHSFFWVFRKPRRNTIS